MRPCRSTIFRCSTLKGPIRRNSINALSGDWSAKYASTSASHAWGLTRLRSAVLSWKNRRRSAAGSPWFAIDCESPNHQITAKPKLRCPAWHGERLPLPAPPTNEDPFVGTPELVAATWLKRLRATATLWFRDSRLAYAARPSLTLHRSYNSDHRSSGGEASAAP